MGRSFDVPREPRLALCEIVAGRAPVQVVEEDELSLCLLDINPFTEGHCLVVSKRHVPWWHDLSEEEIVSLFRMAGRVANRLRNAFSPEFVCLYARGRRHPSHSCLPRADQEGRRPGRLLQRPGEVSGIAPGAGGSQGRKLPGPGGGQDPLGIGRSAAGRCRLSR